MLLHRCQLVAPSEYEDSRSSCDGRLHSSYYLPSYSLISIHPRPLSSVHMQSRLFWRLGVLIMIPSTKGFTICMVLYLQWWMKGQCFNANWAFWGLFLHLAGCMMSRPMYPPSAPKTYVKPCLFSRGSYDKSTKQGSTRTLAR